MNITNNLNKEKIKGVWTAVITPFNEDESIDWESFEGLIKRQLEGNVRGLLLSGTTGESPNITDAECVEMIKRAKKIVGENCLIMVGSGTNSTKKSIEKTKIARDAGADVALIVNPYYNKPTQQGLYLHFKAVADSTDLPVILYNIKGRTGVNLETPTLVRLAKETPNIIGVKEASGDLNQIKSVCNQKLDNFAVFSGDDGLTFKVLKEYGADGVISVASNVVPEKMASMVHFALDGKMDEAEKINEELADLFKFLFIETNPIPVKYAIYEMKLCKNVYRLPMCPIEEEHGKIVKELLKKMNLVA